VVEMVVNHLRTIDPRIYDGKRPESLERGLDEERHEAQRNLVFLPKPLLVAISQGHDGREICLVKGREDRRGLLRPDQGLGDPLANPTQSLPCLTGLRVGPRGRCTLPWGSGSRSRFGRGRGRWLFPRLWGLDLVLVLLSRHVAQDVFSGNPAPRTGAL